MAQSCFVQNCDLVKTDVKLFSKICTIHEKYHNGGACVYKNQRLKSRDIVPEIIDSGPMCIKDLFQNKSILTH